MIVERILSPAVVAWCILFVVFGWLGPGAVSAESWTDLRGTRTIDARMVGLWGDTVVLELTSGKRVSVKLDSLRSESRIQARRMAKKMDQERVQQIQDLEQTSIAAAAAAPDPIPTPEPAPPYQPPSTDLELEPYLQQIDQAIAAGHVLAIYDSLPPSHRKDVDEVVAMVLNKVDPNSFEMLIRCLHRSGMVLVTHQNWLMTSPRIEAMPESAKEQLTGPIMSLAGLLNATLDSDLASLSNMKSEPFGKWLAKFDQASCDYLHQAHRSIGRPIQRTITIESTRDEQTQVTVQSGDDQFKTTLVKVDGYWLPSSYAGPNWDQMIEDLKKAIEASDGSSLLRPLYEKAALAMPVLDTLERSSNANDFHASIESLVEFVATTLPEFSSVLGITTGRDSIRGRTDQYFDDY